MPPIKNLDVKSIEALKPREATYRISDGGGLLIEVRRLPCVDDSVTDRSLRSSRARRGQQRNVGVNLGRGRVPSNGLLYVRKG